MKWFLHCPGNHRGSFLWGNAVGAGLCSARGNHPIYAVSGKRCAASDYKIVTATSYMPFLRREKLDICSKMVLHNPKVAQVAHKSVESPVSRVKSTKFSSKKHWNLYIDNLRKILYPRECKADAQMGCAAPRIEFYFKNFY